jgi:hypothetical protein
MALSLDPSHHHHQTIPEPQSSQSPDPSNINTPAPPDPPPQDHVSHSKIIYICLQSNPWYSNILYLDPTRATTFVLSLHRRTPRSPSSTIPITTLLNPSPTPINSFTRLNTALLQRRLPFTHSLPNSPT